MCGGFRRRMRKILISCELSRLRAGQGTVVFVASDNTLARGCHDESLNVNSYQIARFPVVRFRFRKKTVLSLVLRLFYLSFRVKLLL